MTVNLVQGTRIDTVLGTQIDWTNGFGYLHPLAVVRLGVPQPSPVMFVFGYYLSAMEVVR